MKDHLEEIKKLEDGGGYWWGQGEGSGAEIWKKNFYWFLFEVGQFGGYPRFVKAFHESQLIDLIQTVEKWT